MFLQHFVLIAVASPAEAWPFIAEHVEHKIVLDVALSRESLQTNGQASGRQYRESTHTVHYNKAQKYLKGRITEVASGKFHGIKVDRTVMSTPLNDMIADYVHGVTCIVLTIISGGY